MSKELEILFNSKVRPKILKLFFQNEDKVFNPKEVAKRCRLPQKIAKKEIEKLQKIRLLRRRTQRKRHFYSLNPNFLFLNEIQAILLKISPLYFKELKSLFKEDKKLKLVIISGVFCQEKKSPIDLLVVGEKVERSNISRKVRKIEQDLGKEINWTVMTVEEFEYRTKMQDRFLRDIFDHTYKKIIDRLPRR